MEFIAGLANGFMELFKAGANTFSGWVVGIIPLVVILMTAVSSVIKLIGEERVYRVAQCATKNIITRYTILPILAVMFLGNPMSYTFGRSWLRNISPRFTMRTSASSIQLRDFSPMQTEENSLFTWA